MGEHMKSRRYLSIAAPFRKERFVPPPLLLILFVSSALRAAGNHSRAPPMQTFRRRCRFIHGASFETAERVELGHPQPRRVCA